MDWVTRSEEHTSELQSLRHPLGPYTTLFRSKHREIVGQRRAGAALRANAVFRGCCAPWSSAWIGSRDRKSTRLNSSHLGILSVPTRRSSDLSTVKLLANGEQARP